MTYTLLPKSRSWLWWLAPQYGTVIGNTIYMPSKWYTLPEVEREAWLRHEALHVDQQLNWLRYLTSRAYRREVEIPAYEVQMKYLLAHGRTPRIEEWSGIMSDYGCLSWITRGEAEEALRGWIQT